MKHFIDVGNAEQLKQRSNLRIQTLDHTGQQLAGGLLAI